MSEKQETARHAVDIDTIDHLQRRASQLCALTTSLVGSPGLDNFKTLRRDHQNNLLWLIDDLAQDIHDKLAAM